MKFNVVLADRANFFLMNGLILNLLNSIKTNNLVTVNQNGKQKRDYLFIDDAVDGIIQSIHFYVYISAL